MTPALSRELARLFSQGNLKPSMRLGILAALQENPGIKTIDELPVEYAAVLNYIKETHPEE